MSNFFLEKKKFFILIFLLFFFFKKYEKIIFKSFNPLFFLSYTARSFLKAITFYSNDKGDLYKKYNDLENKYEKLRHEFQSIEYLKNYIIEQKKFLTPFFKYSKPVIPAKILFLKLSHDEQIFFINCGEKDGIKIGNTVINGNDLLGIINKTYQNHSEVLMTTDSRSKVALTFLKKNIKGITQGCNKKNLIQATYVEENSEIKINDLIYSSGEGLIYPEGFLIGKVKEIIKGDGLYVTLLIEPNFEIEKLFNCLVILNEDQLDLKNNYKILDNFLFEEESKKTNHFEILQLTKNENQTQVLQKSSPEKEKIENLENQNLEKDNSEIYLKKIEKKENLNTDKEISSPLENTSSEKKNFENKKNEEIRLDENSEIILENEIQTSPNEKQSKGKRSQKKSFLKKILNFSKIDKNHFDHENTNYSEKVNQ